MKPFRFLADLVRLIRMDRADERHDNETRLRLVAEDHTNDNLHEVHEAIRGGRRIPDGPLADMHHSCANAWASNYWPGMCLHCRALARQVSI
jgi:hypothetical protein